MKEWCEKNHTALLRKCDELLLLLLHHLLTKKRLELQDQGVAFTTRSIIILLTPQSKLSLDGPFASLKEYLRI